MMLIRRRCPFLLMFVLTAALHNEGRRPWFTLLAKQIRVFHTSCIKDCTCMSHYTMNTPWLSISECLRTPTEDMDSLLQANINISGFAVYNAHLSSLPVTLVHSLSKLRHLQFLDFSGNALNDLPWESLWNLDLHSLVVSRNDFTILRNGIFYGFKNILYLDFSFNKISEIEQDVFSGVRKLPNLEYLDLRGNQLLSLDPWFLMFSGRPMTMTFDYNRISRFTNRPGWTLPDDMTYWPYNLHRDSIFTATYNNISHISDLTQGWNLTIFMAIYLFSVKNVDITQNPITCICKEHDTSYLYGLVYNLPLPDCSSPDRPEVNKLNGYPVSAFTCDVNEQCPARCHCIDTSVWHNMTVVCPNIGMKDLPRVLPPRPREHYRYHLFLQHNNLTSIEYRPYLEFVETMSLRHNKIRNLSLATLHNFTNLKYLYLDHNSLERLPDADPNYTLDLVSLSEVYLGNNSWICDCHSLETKHWLLKHKAVIKDPDAVMCESPERLRGTNLLLLSDDKFICGDPPSQQTKTIMTAIGGTLTVCLILFILSITVLYSKRIWIYNTFKWHPLDWDECQGENKQYDVFVSYSNEDEAYVENYLIPVLRFHGFKVCFHREHFIPGTSIVDNIEQAVGKSKRTLVFLSDSFTASSLCIWEFTLALNMDIEEGTRRLVVVKDTSLDIGNVNNAVKCYLRRFTYVERESLFFWEQLSYILPINKLGTPGDQNQAIVIDESILTLEDFSLKAVV